MIPALGLKIADWSKAQRWKGRTRNVHGSNPDHANKKSLRGIKCERKFSEFQRMTMRREKTKIVL